MRILQLVTAFQYRGAEIAALQFSRELVSLGHQVYYVSLYASNDDFAIYPGIEAKCLNGRKQGLFDVSILFALSRVISEFKPDVVQANAGDTLKYASVVKLFQLGGFCLVFRNASTVSRYIRSTTQKIFNRFLYSRVDRVLSVSKESKRDLIAVFPQLNGRVEVVPNGIKIEAVVQPSADDGALSIVHVGGFSFEKNHSGLIRIFQRVLLQVPKARLKLIGHGPLLPKIQADVAAAGLSDKIEFVGASKDVLKFIAGGDVLVLPSVIEGLPAVILEGFLCMTPVVAYDVGGISEIVHANETGWLVKAGDEESFSEAVVEAITSTDETMLINAHRLLRENYDIEKLVKRLIQEYHSLMTVTADQ